MTSNQSTAFEQGIKEESEILDLSSYLNVTEQYIGSVQEIVTQTCQAYYGFGTGRDVTDDLLRGDYNYLRVTGVYQLSQDSPLWKAYAHSKHRIESHMAIHGTKFYKKTQIEKQWMSQSISLAKNEKYLFSGIRKQYIKNVAEDGLDPKYFPLKRHYGCGMYFSDSAGKADQYSTDLDNSPDQNVNCFMFLCRVSLGNPLFFSTPLSERTFGSTSVQDMSSIPIVRNNCHVPPFHSVWALSGSDRALKRHDEMIIFDKSQAVPEFLISYRRILYSSRTLLVRNYPFQSLKEFCEKYFKGIKVEQPKELSQHRPQAFVHFQDLGDAKRGIKELDGKFIEKQAVEAQFIFESSSLWAQQDTQGLIAANCFQIKKLPS